MKHPRLSVACLLAFLQVACYIESAPLEGAPYTPCRGIGSLDLVVPEGTLSGVVDLSLTIRHEDSTPVDLTLTWSSDGEAWKALTLVDDPDGEVEDLPSSPEGTPVTLRWSSAADLGIGRFSGLTIKAVGHSSCAGLDGVPLPPVLVSDLAVTNEVGACSVEILDPTAGAAIGGDVPIRYNLRHPAGDPVCVEAVWTKPHMEARNIDPMAGVDCDLDEAPDSLDWLDTSADGVEHCLVWDSDSEINENMRIGLRLTCGPCRPAGRIDIEQGRDQIDMVSLQNNPVPQPDELRITEIMARSGRPQGNYIEITNVSNHILDLVGVVVKRWDAGRPLDQLPSGQFAIDSLAGTLALRPGERAVLAGSEDLAGNGCLRPDATWEGQSFNLFDRSVLALDVAGQRVVVLDFSDFATWSFNTDRALGLDPSFETAADWSNRNHWCEQVTRIPACAQVPNLAEQGTPGGVNDACQ